MFLEFEKTAIRWRDDVTWGLPPSWRRWKYMALRKVAVAQNSLALLSTQPERQLGTTFQRAPRTPAKWACGSSYALPPSFILCSHKGMKRIDRFMKPVPIAKDTAAEERLRRNREALDGWIKPKPEDRDEADKPRI